MAMEIYDTPECPVEVLAFLVDGFLCFDQAEAAELVADVIAGTAYRDLDGGLPAVDFHSGRFVGMLDDVNAWTGFFTSFKDGRVYEINERKDPRLSVIYDNL